MMTGTPQDRAIRATWSSNSVPDIASFVSCGLGVNAPTAVANRKRGTAAISNGVMAPIATVQSRLAPDR